MILSLLSEQPFLFVLWIMAIIYALTVHEFSHAAAAELQGDNTARLSGRLSLNPLAHIDWTGLIFLLLAGFGWGRPVPFNPWNLRNKRFGSFLVAIAGPGANAISVVIFGITLKIIQDQQWLSSENLLVAFLVILIQLNTLLFVFNLIPLPPLDGSKIWSVVAPRFFERIGPMLDRMGPVVLLGLLLIDAILPISPLQTLFTWATNGVFAFFLG